MRAIALLLPLCWAFVAHGNDLDTLIHNPDLKFIFVGGKGGVGKTTSSSAIASQLSLSLTKSGKSRRVLLISTDPAHSLSDAFRMPFSNVPTAILPHLPNLEVMEVNPQETMKAELGQWHELAKELGYDPSGADADENSVGAKIHGFQEWLSGVPGIDEATALSSAIEHIESGRYDLIVFDTAPTGHTLKLLELPRILQAGLDKLESWQATLWGYWEMFRGLTSGGAQPTGIKEKVSKKLRDYKGSIGRVSDMIRDKARTRFVVVCISEYLSISESRRLLSELDRFEVLASHVLVNQLVLDYLNAEELTALEALVEAKDGTKDGAVLKKALASAKLTSARHAIQSKYLKDLRSCPEVKRKPDPTDPTRTNSKAGPTPLSVLEVPLLPTEVTGPEAILEFSKLLVGKTTGARAAAAMGVKGEREAMPEKKPRKTTKTVREGHVTSEEKEQFRKEQEQKEWADKAQDMGDAAKDFTSKANSFVGDLVKDPKVMELIKENPKLATILDEVKANPMAGLKYLMDPEVAPLVQQAMANLDMGGKTLDLSALGSLAGGGRKRRRKGKGGPAMDLAGLAKMAADMGIAGKNEL